MAAEGTDGKCILHKTLPESASQTYFLTDFGGQRGQVTFTNKNLVAYYAVWLIKDGPPCTFSFLYA